MKDIRPLDPVHSIRTKLGVLVAVTIGVAAVLTAVGIGQGLSPVYTVPVVVLGALAVTRVLARGMTSPLREMTSSPTSRTSCGRRSRRCRRCWRTWSTASPRPTT
jgi:two-component system sensor histidine kinase BaeS